MIDKLMKVVIKAFTIVSFIGITLCIFTMGGYIPPVCAMAVTSIAWMPIPTFDEILENNKDVLERIKEKGD